MSQENVELAKILLPQPGTDIVPLIRDEDTYARMAEAVPVPGGEDLLSFRVDHRNEQGARRSSARWCTLG